MLKIDQALISTFIDADFGLPIAHENINYTPVLGTAYAQLIVAQNDLTKLDISDTNETDGIFRVILRYPSGVGSISAKEMADQIQTVYKIGSSLQYDGQDLEILSFSRNEGVAETGWYKIIITVRYRAFIRR